MKKLIAVAAFAATGFSSIAYAADAPAPDYTLTANTTVASEYRYRGIAQTGFKPAIQGGFDFAHSNGFYLGNWNSNISWISDAGVAKTAPIEMDFYGGYKGELTKGLGYDVGGLYYYYPTTGLTGVNPNTFELYGALTYGSATLKYSQSTTNLFGNADSKNSYYVDFSLNQDLGAYGLTANAHVGYQKIKNVVDASYTDWKLGLTKDFGGGLSGALAYVGTNAKDTFYKSPAFDGKNGGKGTVVISLTKSF